MNILEFVKLRKMFGSGGGASGIIEVNELPTENIDKNALYLCKGKYFRWRDDENTRIFNDELNFEGLPTGEYGAEFSLEDGTSYTAFAYSERYNGVYMFRYGNWNDRFGYLETRDVYQTDELWGISKGWTNNIYKTVTFSKLPTDEVFNVWLDANTKTGSGFVEFLAPSGMIELQEIGVFNVYDYAKVRINPPTVYWTDTPSDAVDGSVSLYQTGANEMWRLNDELDFSTLPKGTAVALQFRSCGRTFTTLRVDHYGPSVEDNNAMCLVYYDEVTNGTKVAYGYSPEGKYGLTHGWVNEDARYVTLETYSPLVSNWLQANGALEGVECPFDAHIMKDGQWFDLRYTEM